MLPYKRPIMSAHAFASHSEGPAKAETREKDSKKVLFLKGWVGVNVLITALSLYSATSNDSEARNDVESIVKLTDNPDVIEAVEKIGNVLTDEDIRSIELAASEHQDEIAADIQHDLNIVLSKSQKELDDRNHILTRNLPVNLGLLAVAGMLVGNQRILDSNDKLLKKGRKS